jgi:hypothetical protein
MRRVIPPFPDTPSWRDAQLKKAQGQLYLLPSLKHLQFFHNFLVINSYSFYWLPLFLSVTIPHHVLVSPQSSRILSLHFFYRTNTVHVTTISGSSGPIHNHSVHYYASLSIMCSFGTNPLLKFSFPLPEENNYCVLSHKLLQSHVSFASNSLRDLPIVLCRFCFSFLHISLIPIVLLNFQLKYIYVQKRELSEYVKLLFYSFLGGTGEKPRSGQSNDGFKPRTSQIQTGHLGRCTPKFGYSAAMDWRVNTAETCTK